jgi:predicted secreted protein
MMLNDEYWSKLEKILLQESIDNKRNLRMTVEAYCIECGLAVHGAICPRCSAAGILSINDSMQGH